MVDYHQRDDFNAKQGEEIKLILPNAKAMLSVVKHAANCMFLDVWTRLYQNGHYSEFIVCVICDDGIPTKNEYGIKYREHIAFEFDQELHRVIPRTIALRKDFPSTIHQNLSPYNAKDLCLYAEESRVTATSWTPERHIQRTKWWLVRASKGELHADNQILEPVFFTPLKILILPHDFEQGLKDNRQPAIYEGGYTIYSELQWKTTGKTNTNSVNLLHLVTPSITQGRIYLPPFSFYHLQEFMSSMHIDITELVRNQLFKFYREQQGHFLLSKTILLLSIPIRRANNSQHERYQHIGFNIDRTVAQLLSDFEIKSSELPNVDADGNLRPMSNTTAQTFAITPMEIISKTDKKTRRTQSGYNTDIGDAVLIGAGALGGCLLDIWARGGWGQWTVVDDDDLKPHNLTRHVGHAFGIGSKKADYLTRIINHDFEIEFEAVTVNASDEPGEKLKTAYARANVVIDASASLDYPRTASYRQHVPRHISAFFSPNGEDAVLLVEDRKRRVRLNALEAQYYRALMSLPIGETHLKKEPIDTFRSGMSCRDVSVVMPYSRVQSLSSLLADQIRYQSEQDSAKIRIWHEDLQTGNRELTEIPVWSIKRNKGYIPSRFEFDIVWDDGIEQKVRELRKKALPNETGGIIVGFHDMTHKTVFIVDALPAPADSQGTPSSFDRGIHGVQELLEKISAQTGGNVGYIGEWHSHPDGSSSRQSKMDINQLTELAESLSMDGLPAYQMIVSQTDIKVYEKEFKHD